jgi:hypothetical protein
MGGQRSAWPVRVAYVYLAAPTALFFAGWLKWYWLVPALAALGVGLWRMWLAAPKVFVPARSRRTVAVGAAVCLIMAAGTVLSGIGGVSYQHSDHAWRNVIFEMLVVEPWPVVIDSSVGSLPLTYYFGFWLPAALVGKLGPMAVGWAALLLWTWLCLVIFVGLVRSLLKRFAVWSSSGRSSPRL